MIPKDISQITESDLFALIENETYERKDIEYKQSLSLYTDKEKKEFLADVSSFANSISGDLIIGITEDKATGKPNAVVGISVENIDQEKLRIAGIIQSGIQPRIPQKDVFYIKLKNGNYVLIVRIYRSWIGPHRIIFNGWDKFYSRTSAGKYPLDVDEIRLAFSLSETGMEKVNNFIDKRISKIISDDTPVVCYKNPKIILHLVPLSSNSHSLSIDIGKIDDEPHAYDGLLRPLGHSPNNTRFNFDGYLLFVGDYSRAGAYTQLFRGGAIEAVEAFMLEITGEKKIFRIEGIEKEIIDATKGYLTLQKKLGVPYPIVMKLTFVGVRGYIFSFENAPPEFIRKPIDQDLLILPPQLIDNQPNGVEGLLRSSFDTLWGAAGYPRDLFFDKNGKWDPAQCKWPY